MLDYMSKDAAYRKYHHNNLTFGMIYAFSENFALPFSHDEVVYGKGSMINKMPGDDWQKFANLRALYALMFGYPGKKLNFMGGEIAQYSEWQHDGSIHWHLLEQAKHRGVLDLIKDLNQLYREHPALHETDCDGQGFEWIDCDDIEQSVISFYRYSNDRTRNCIIICNFTPVIRQGYTIECYGGSGQVNLLPVVSTGDAATLHNSNSPESSNVLTAGVVAEPHPAHSRPASLTLTIPPLGVLILERTGN